MAIDVTLKRVNSVTGTSDELSPTTRWAQINEKPSTYTPTAHTHSISNVDGLQTALDGKANSAHTHDDRYYTESEIQNNTTYMRDMRVNANGVPTSNLGSPSVTEMALFQEQFNNKTEFYDITKIKFYTSSDNTTWTEYTSFTDDNKRKFVGGDVTSTINIPNNTKFFRIEILNDGNYVYLNALYMYWSSSGHSTKVRIWKRPHNTQVWTIVANSSASISAWPGHMYLPFPTIPFHPSGTSHADAIRIEFENTWNLNSGTNPYGWNLPIYLHKIQIWGGYPAGKRTIYSVNEFKDVDFPGQLKEIGQRVYSPNNKPLVADVTGLQTALDGKQATLASGSVSEATTGTETAQRTWSPSILKSAIQALSDLDTNTNNYLTGLSFNTGDGVLTATRSGLSNLTVDLDGRYAYSSHDHNILKEASNISYGTAGLQWMDVSGVGGTGANGQQPENPTDNWYHHLIMNHANASGYYTDIITSFHEDRMFFKKVSNGVQGDIQEIYHTGHKPQASEIEGLGSSYRWLTDTYINTWNAKQNAMTSLGLAEITTGTDTTMKGISAQILKQAIEELSDLDTNTNNYLTGVSGSGDGTVTFTRQGLSNLTWDASHTHSEYQLASTAWNTSNLTFSVVGSTLTITTVA